MCPDRPNDPVGKWPASDELALVDEHEEVIAFCHVREAVTFDDQLVDGLSTFLEQDDDVATVDDSIDSADVGLVGSGGQVIIDVDSR